MVFKIEQVFIQTDKGIREAYRIRPVENSQRQVVRNEEGSFGLPEC